MNKIKPALLLLTFLSGICRFSRAATVEYDFLPIGPGEYHLFVQVHPDNGDVLGLAAFDFEVNGPLASSITWDPTPISGFDLSLSKPVGFTTHASGTVEGPGSTRKVVAATQHPTDSDTHVYGIGIEDVYVDTLPTPLHFSTPAKLGTIHSPVPLSPSYFTDVHFLLFPAEGGEFVSPTASSGFGAHQPFPRLFSFPQVGTTVDFGDQAGTRELISFTNFPTQSEIVGAEITGADADLFSITPFGTYDFVGSESFPVDVHFAGLNRPGDFSALLTLSLSTSGFITTYDYPLFARVSAVPEPFTVVTGVLLAACISLGLSFSKSNRGFKPC